MARAHHFAAQAWAAEWGRHTLLPTAVYVHLPFCRARCHYCDFAVLPLGRRPASRVVDRYVNTLVREIHQTVDAVSSVAPSGVRSLRTVYFGGGTPSLLSPRELNRVLTTLRSTMGIDHNAEVTLEVDPGTYNAEYLAEVQDLGVTRFSIGVQSWDDTELKLANRQHTAAEAMTAVELVTAACPATWSVDLIYGWPHQTLSSWKRSLKQTISLNPPHLAVYGLTIEPHTRFGHLFKEEEPPLPSDNLAADMFETAHAALVAAGFEHYEVSSYALPGNHSRHNKVYWSNSGWWGFGLGATSHVGGRKYQRSRSATKWSSWVEKATPAQIGGAVAGHFAEWNATERRDVLLDLICGGLRHELETERLRQLVDARAVAHFDAERTRLIEAGLLERTDAGAVRLVGPTGMLKENAILRALTHSLDL